MTRIVIADDQTVVREGIKIIIEQDPDLKVVGCAGDGQEAASLCDALAPDVVLMDIVMPNCDGIEGLRIIKERHPSIKILMLTTFRDEDKIARAIQNGADGYVLKDIRPIDLLATIKSMAGELRVVQQEVFSAMARQYDAVLRHEEDKVHIEDIGLTEREIGIVQLIVFGKTNKEIAASVNLSEGSVRNIISVILRKLNLRDRIQLAVFAVSNNLF